MLVFSFVKVSSPLPPWDLITKRLTLEESIVHFIVFWSILMDILWPIEVYLVFLIIFGVNNSQVIL